ncbi:hypothetical protein [Agrococcus sp. DT81.2]|uniref:hypothetical protein n=1 Tax=Agrococcus sp. DT81.2 TaxID=3393414 RepID=UPI003CE55EBC
MNELRIERMTAAVADWPDPGEVLGMLRHVAESRLDDALRQQPLPDGEWCVRRLDISVELDPERPFSALETGWADRIVAALRLSLLDGSSDVVQFVRPEDAVDDLFTGLVAHRHAHAWAWHQLGLIEPGDPVPEEDARGLLLAVLHRMRHESVGALARLVAGAGVAPVHRLLGAQGWRQAAVIASRDAGATLSTLSDAGTHATEPPVSPSSSGGLRGDLVDGPAVAALGARIAASGSFARAFRSCGLRVDGETLAAWAVLATAEVDPTVLRRSDESVRELTRIVAALLTPEPRPGMPSAARSTAPSAAAAGAVSGEARTAHDRPHGTDALTDTDTSTGADRDPVTETQPALAELRTAWGGLLFLLNTADLAGIPEALDRPPFDARPSGWVLHRIARLLVPAAADDPAVLAFGGLDAPPDDEPDAFERRALEGCAARWGRRTARLLRATGTDGGRSELVHRVAKRDAAVDREPGWIEICLSLADVDRDIRRAGLDVDPGWLAWLGRVVRFRYE